jgi:SAM-dependent methyltransferase
MESAASEADMDSYPGGHIMSQTLERPPVETPVETPAEPWRQPPAAAARDAEYVPFADVETRNGLQARIEIPLMLRCLGLPCGGRILEVGCGRGVALPVLAERLVPSELVGLDVDPALLQVARQRLDAAGTAATLVEGDVRDLPFPDASFDVVIDFGTCYHASDRAAERIIALREVSRVLRDGGLFVHETRLAQRLAHPVRSIGRTLPWRRVPSLVRHRGALLWGARRRTEREPR